MTRRRCDIVDAENCGVYHCISRCVRRQSLIACIERREWVVSRLEFLAQSAAIDVISFAVMENHLHLLLRTRPEVVRGWTDREVALRRARMLPNRRLRRSVGTPLDGEPTDEEIAAIMSSRRYGGSLGTSSSMRSARVRRSPFRRASGRPRGGSGVGCARCCATHAMSRGAGKRRN